MAAGEQPDREALRDEMLHEPIVQEFVESTDEYVFCAAYDHGDALATFQHRQVHGDSYTGGGVYRETVDIPELDAVGRKLLDYLDWHGPACIEYMRDADTGEFVLAEINPQMWQSLACAVHSGADFPYYYYWLQATDRADEIDPRHDVGTGSHLLYGELGHLLSIYRENSPLVDRPSLPGRALEIATSCYDVPQFDTLRLDDPMPFLSGIRRVLTGDG